MISENMVRVHGEVHTEITLIPEAAVGVLYSDCTNHDKNISLSNENTDEKSVEISKAISVLMNNYSSVVGKGTEIDVASVFDTFHLQYYVSSIDVLQALWDNFTKGERDLCTQKYTDKKERGVYSYYDASQHGSPDWQYFILYKGAEAEEVFEALKLLNRDYYDFVYASKEENPKVKEKKQDIL